MSVLSIIDAEIVKAEAVETLRLGQAVLYAANGNQQVAVVAGERIAVPVRVFAISHDTLLLPNILLIQPYTDRISKT